MTKDEAITVIKEYRSNLKNSVSNQLDGDIEAFEMAIKALEQEKPETVTEFADRCRECGARYGKLLKDAVSRQAVMDIIEFFKDNPQHFSFVNLIDDIKEIPPINPQVKTDVPEDITPATPEYQKVYMQGWSDGRRDIIEKIKREFKI